MIESRMGILSLLDEVTAFCALYIFERRKEETLIMSRFNNIVFFCIWGIYNRNHDYRPEPIKAFVINFLPISIHLHIKDALKSLVSQTVLSQLFIMPMTSNMKLKTSWKRIRILCPMNILPCYKMQTRNS